MNFVIGDKLVLLADVVDLEKYNINPNSNDAILYPAGTEAVLEGLDKGFAYVRFPDGEVVPHHVMDILLCFNRVVNDKLMFSRLTEERGTPNRELGPYLPKEVDWRKNYRYTITIEAEDLGLKQGICPRCYNEIIPDVGLQDEKGLQKCSKCDMMTEVIDPLTFEYPKEQDYE